MLGYHYLKELKNVDSEQLFEGVEKRHGCKAVRCQLYVYRYLTGLLQYSLKECKSLRW